MNYWGKTLDHFEAAVNQLLEFQGHPPIDFIGCISLRCFGFAVESEISKWFGPRVEIDQSVSALSSATGIEFSCQKVLPNQILDHMWGNEAVLGPIQRGIAAPELKQYYYDGHGRFLSIRRVAKDCFEVYDPSGMPGAFLSSYDISRLVPTCGAYFIFGKCKGNTMNVVSPRKILYNGIRFHRQIGAYEQNEIIHACREYTPGRGNRLSLTFAVMNLVLQFERVFQLAYACGTVPQKIMCHYIREKMTLYQYAECESTENIAGSIMRIWELLEDYGAFLGLSCN